jgi:hypothetical protein
MNRLFPQKGGMTISQLIADAFILQGVILFIMYIMMDKPNDLYNNIIVVGMSLTSAAGLSLLAESVMYG